ncbi:MAG TPA: hypothetical protein DEB46_14805, partial [Myxococcales bacterium]|nr:hypothetical protein [Myxococcales bacterium]
MKSALYISSNEQFRSLFAGALKPLGFKVFHYVYNADSALRAMKRQDYSVIIFHEIAQGRPKDLLPIERLRSQTNAPMVLVGYPMNFFEQVRAWIAEEESLPQPDGEEPSTPPTESEDGSADSSDEQVVDEENEDQEANDSETPKS